MCQSHSRTRMVACECRQALVCVVCFVWYEGLVACDGCVLEISVTDRFVLQFVLLPLTIFSIFLSFPMELASVMDFAVLFSGWSVIFVSLYQPLNFSGRRVCVCSSLRFLSPLLSTYTCAHCKKKTNNTWHRVCDVMVSPFHTCCWRFWRRSREGWSCRVRGIGGRIRRTWSPADTRTQSVVCV